MLSVEFFVRELPKSTAQKQKNKKSCTFQFYFFLWAYETVPGSENRKTETVQMHTEGQRYVRTSAGCSGFRSGWFWNSNSNFE